MVNILYSPISERSSGGFMNIYENRIGPLFDKSGLTDKALEENIGLPRGIIYKWKNGKNKNYKFYVVEIAAYFHVSPDYLLGSTDDQTPAEQKEKPPGEGELNKEEKEIIDLYNRASPELRAAALAMLRAAEDARKAQGEDEGDE